MAYSKNHRSKIKQSILDNARRLFIEKGLAATSIIEIMAACGLTHGGFYSYFTSKHDLYRQAIALDDQTDNGMVEPPHSQVNMEWEQTLLAGFVDVASLSTDRQVMPLSFFAKAMFNETSNGKVDSEDAYTKALNTTLARMVACLNTDIYRGEPVLLALTAMAVGADVISRNVKDSYIEHNLRLSCQHSARELWANTQPINNPLIQQYDYFWDYLSA